VTVLCYPPGYTYTLEAFSKIGFWFKIAAGPGFKPQVRLRRIEDLKRGTNKDIEPKDIFEMASKQHNTSCRY
jgi:hypothetical protein